MEFAYKHVRLRFAISRVNKHGRMFGHGNGAVLDRSVRFEFVKFGVLVGHMHVHTAVGEEFGDAIVRLQLSVYAVGRVVW